ncbi:MAG: bacillithiol biosynthesis cysteine-adding enzyme BshC [Gemmatimonadota bacterium]|nr:MAG: bacillithiol biosynthesis cysteine-adding enzyme BshC [Gemmatimonadota bacterium]
MNVELIVGWPDGSDLARDYLEGSDRATPYYGASWRDPSAYRAKLDDLDARFDADARRTALSAMNVPDGVSKERLDSWVEKRGLVVTTGQQPGLLGGPLYSLYKALTTMSLARALEAELGRPVLPLFWVASDDHDWAEADHTYAIDSANELRLVQVADPGAKNRPIHRVEFSGELDNALSEFLQILPSTDFSDDYIKLLRHAHDSSATLSSSFQQVMEGLLGPQGLFFTDAANPVVKDRSSAVLLAEVDAGESEALLRGTAESLEADGYHVQVHIMEGGVNLFLEGPGGRERLYRDGDGFHLHNSGARLTREDILARIQEDPSVLSPNVLLRPIVESEVFPVVSYVAGPGEIAYYAQIRGLYESHGMKMPVIHPRHGVTAVEPKIRKVMDKFDVGLETLGRPYHEVASEIAKDEVPAGVRTALGEFRGAVGEQSSKLLEAALAIDPTLKGPVTHARNTSFAAIQEAEKKIVQSVKRQNEIALGQLEKAQLHLFPKGKPQERVLNPFYYLFRFGNPFMAALVDALKVDLPSGSK